MPAIFVTPTVAKISEAIAQIEQAISGASVAELPALSGELDRLRATAWARMMTPQQPRADATARGEEDRYLTMRQVATRTGLSRSYLYELARTGDLPARPMGKSGKGPRGYRVLFSDLLTWEDRRRQVSVDDRINNMLSSGRERRRVSAPPTAARADTGRTRGQDRRPSDHGLPLGARAERRPRTRGETDSSAHAEPAT